jgi:hypothetical protein
MAPPIVDPVALGALLGGHPDAELVALCADASSAAVAAVVDGPPVDAAPEWVWPANVTWVGLAIGADVYKSITAPGAGYQLDGSTFLDASRITSALMKRYETLLNPSRAVEGMVG